MKAVILAGGEGARLRPITYEIPKPLIPVKKKTIVEHLIELLERYDITDIGVLISAEHEPDYKRWHARKDLHRIELFTEPRPHGTFGWLKHLRGWLGDNSFAVINGDTLLDIDLHALRDAHEKHAPVATLALVHTDDANARGIVTMDGDHITDFTYKKEESAPSIISAGCVIFYPDVFAYADPAQEHVMIEDDILPKLVREKKLVGVEMKEGRCYDCGTLARWEKAIKEW